MTSSFDKKGKPTPARRSEAGGLWGRLAQGTARIWQRLLEMRGLWLALFVGLCAWCLVPRDLDFAPQVEIGRPADRDYIAPTDLLVPDEETTLARQQRARDDVLPVYDLDPTPVTLEQIRALFDHGRTRLEEQAGSAQARSGEAAEDAGGPPRAETATEEAVLELTAEQGAVLEQQGFSPELEDRLVGVADQLFRRGIVESKERLLGNRSRGITVRNIRTGEESDTLDVFDYLGHADEVRERVESELRSWMGLTGQQRRALVDFLTSNLEPNLLLNQNETIVRQEAAALATSPSFSQVRKGEIIVRKGDIVNGAALRKIDAYRRDRSWQEWLLPVFGTVLLLAMMALVVGLALRTEKESRVAHHSDRQLLSETLMMLTVSILGTKLMYTIGDALALAFDAAPLNSPRSYIYAVPFAALGICATLLLGRQAAFVLSAIFALLISRMLLPDSLWVVLYALAGSLAAIYALDRYQVRQRVGLMRIGLVVSLVNMAVMLMLLALAGEVEIGVVQLLFDLGCAAAGGVLAAAVASFANPVFESILGITTDIKLAELANTNLPLLRRLAFEAPGSFQHSLMVANLAKQACEAIDADPSLAYTGGLYHDVGKVFRSEYFIENQRTGVNPHDKLQPTMSAMILISHVKDGVQLARDHHLPQPLIDAIEQHHGTRLIKYFYSRAKEQAGGDEGEVSEEKFRYPGPKPQSKVMGVLMLADAVEAASRTLVEPSPVKIRTLIRTIVEDCLQDGQLDQTDLTLSDLRRISESFLRVLSNIFHHRVDYPGFNFNTEPGEKGGRQGKGDPSGPRLAVVGGAKVLPS